MRVSLFKEAGLGPTDISRFTGVSRVTASSWMNFRTSPSSLVAEKLQKLIDATERALDAGDLPLPYEVSRRERGQIVQSILNSHVHTGAALTSR